MIIFGGVFTACPIVAFWSPKEQSSATQPLEFQNMLGIMCAQDCFGDRGLLVESKICMSPGCRVSLSVVKLA